MTRRIDVRVTHLLLRGPDRFRPARAVPTGVRVAHLRGDDAGEWAATCYLRVGQPWLWTDRQHWTAVEWRDWLDRVAGEVWVARDLGGMVGFFVLERADRDVRVSYLGLVPTAIGRGIGGWLLGRAVERAWSIGARHVTLDTCSLDGPAALPNYLARGFEVVREEFRVKELDDESG